jgi:hypothetical protein
VAHWCDRSRPEAGCGRARLGHGRGGAGHAPAARRRGEWIWTTPWDIFATEGQWYFGERGHERSRVDVNDLLTLAFRAGFTLACVPAARVAAHPA